MFKKLSSRKLWIAAATSAVMLVALYLGKDISWAETAAVLGPVFAYVGGESYIDAKRKE